MGERRGGIPLPMESNFTFSDSTVKVVGDYNLTENGEVINVDKAIFRNYIPWDGTSINLLQGYVRQPHPFVGRGGNVALFQMLKWIEVRKYSLSDNKINFVSKRGILRSIAETAIYNRYSKWQYKVCRYNDIIYIGSNRNPKEKENEAYPAPLYASTFFVGTRMENNTDLFAYHVAECNFKDIKCLIAGETKCKMKGQDEYIELKGTKMENFDWRSRGGWIQAYLLGNQSVAYGLRNDDFFLEEVRKLKVEDIPRNYASWNGCAMLGFVYSVLQKLQEKVKEGTTCILKCNVKEYGRYYYITVDDDNGVFLNPEFKKYIDEVEIN